LDANQRIQRLMGVLNMVGKSGFVNPEPIITEICELAGLDPAVIITKPNPPQTEPANISLRLTGAEDLMNPLVLAFLYKSGQAPGPELMLAAKKAIAESMQALTPEEQQPQPAPIGPEGAPPAPPNTAPAGQPEDWNTMSKINKRSDYV
jgi:hypothetical protein